jgi:hypothetical protein
MEKYKIENIKSKDEEERILRIHYGNLWESALDRLSHQPNGYIMTIHHKDNKFKIYRKLFVS